MGDEDEGAGPSPPGEDAQERRRLRGTAIDPSVLSQGESANVGGRKVRGTVIDPSVLSKEGKTEGGRRPRGTVIDPNVLAKGGEKVIKPLPGVYLDEAGEPISTADKVPDRVKFPRKSIIQQICFGEVDEPPASDAEPKRGALKSFNRGSIYLDKGELQRSDSLEYNQTEEAQMQLFKEYGLSSVMTNEVIARCSQIYHMKVLLDNGPLMRTQGGKSIEGNLKDTVWMKLEDDKRLAVNADQFDLSVSSCPMLTELQDMCYFLIHLAATMGLPATFEVFTRPKNFGGMRRIEAPGGSGNKSKAEDYIPLSDQVESALEMIEKYRACMNSTSCGNLDKLYEDVRTMYDDECLAIEKQEKKILVTMITASYPWGRRGGDRDLPDFRSKFLKLMNEFADLPVTFLFVVESQDEKVIGFYDNLELPNVKVGKGLGLMIDGVKENNPWLNYCLPMHLCHTLGISSTLLSQAASRPLNAMEVRELCDTMIGDVPDPSANIDDFLGAIGALMAEDENSKWNPILGKDTPLIDVAKLKKHLNPSRLVGVLAAILVCILAIIIGQLRGHFGIGA